MSNVIPFDNGQAQIWVIDDGVWCPGFLMSEDPMADEIQVLYTDRNGAIIEDFIPNNRDNVRIREPKGGTTVARPGGHLDFANMPRREDKPKPREPVIAYAFGSGAHETLKLIQEALAGDRSISPERRHDFAEAMRLALEVCIPFNTDILLEQFNTEDN